MKTIVFDKNKDVEFVKTLKMRVNKYFQTNNISRYANTKMIVKTICMFTLYFGPYALMVSGIVTSNLVSIIMWSIMGLGIAGVGMSVMHDANHGAYSKSPIVNKILGYSMNMLGGNTEMWKYQHNVLHHTYTNIEEADGDIDSSGILRFSPHQKLNPIHKFQFIYAWLLYCLMTLVKVIYSDYTRGYTFYKKGLIKTKKELRKSFLQVTLWKIFYLAFILVIPIAFTSIPVLDSRCRFYYHAFYYRISACLHFSNGSSCPSM